MKPEMTRYFGDLLETKLKEVFPVMLKLDSCLKEDHDVNDPMDEVELTTRMSEKQRLAQIQNRTQRLVLEIYQALKRVDRGNYGICEECGCDIEIKRLQAQPMATLCIHCKREMEIMDRRKVA